jgi:CTP synthase (UTP-ammonia lyase)
MTKKIALLGDFDPKMHTLAAINRSIAEMEMVLDRKIGYDWFDTDLFDYRKAFSDGYGGLWVTPGSPYKNMDNVLNAIRFTRENSIPTFGNCGGFQHMVIEFARNVCGIELADHQETNPDAEAPVIVKLACSLVQQSEELSVSRYDSLLYKLLGKKTFTGRYFCSYGVNDSYLEALEKKGLIFAAQSSDGQKRTLELPGHPYFLGTLFQPAISSTAAEPDPLIMGFIARCLG